MKKKRHKWKAHGFNKSWNILYAKQIIDTWTCVDCGCIKKKWGYRTFRFELNGEYTLQTPLCEPTQRSEKKSSSDMEKAS